jgi:hypothetical protein
MFLQIPERVFPVLVESKCDLIYIYIYIYILTAQIIMLTLLQGQSCSLCEALC